MKSPLESPSCSGLSGALPDATYSLPAAKPPGNFLSCCPQPRNWQLRWHFPRRSAESSPSQRGSPSPGSAFLSLCRAVPVPAVKLQPSFLGLLGPRLRMLGDCLSLMAPVFTFYYSPAGGEKESWERSESFCPPPPPRGAPVSPGTSLLSPSSLSRRGPRGVEAPASFNRPRVPPAGAWPRLPAQP